MLKTVVSRPLLAGGLLFLLLLAGLVTPQRPTQPATAHSAPSAQPTAVWVTPTPTPALWGLEVPEADPLPDPKPKPPVTKAQSCAAQYGEFKANAPRGLKESRDALGTRVTTRLPDGSKVPLKDLVNRFFTELCGNGSSLSANRSLAASLYAKLHSDSNPNAPFKQAQWAAQAKELAGAVQWDKIQVLYDYELKGKTHYTFAAVPHRGPPQRQPQLYITYLPHRKFDTLIVPVLVNGQYHTLGLRIPCGFQLIMQEQEYVQWDGRFWLMERAS